MEKKSEIKREYSNSRRMQSIKERQLDRNLQAKQIKDSLQNLDSAAGLQSKKIVFQSDESDEDESCADEGIITEDNVGFAKQSLFQSDSEDEDNNIDKQFQIKQHFQGEKGQQLFYASSGITDERFRFTEDFAEDLHQETVVNEDDNEENEKAKNFEILEKVLGFQLPKKISNIDPDAGEKKKRKYVHFDPEEMDLDDFIKPAEVKEQPEKEKDVTCQEEEVVATVSPDRYFEVSADLKNILQEPAKEFSLSKALGLGCEESEVDRPLASTVQTEENHQQTARNSFKTNSFSPSEGFDPQQKTFFIVPGDIRLTEGVDFFKRTQPMEEIHQTFLKTRDVVLDIFKQKRKSSMRRKVPRASSFQSRSFNTKHRHNRNKS